MSESDDKYITFRREDFDKLLAAQPAVRGHELRTEFQQHELPDAVVIRRQDLFAAPALATYASCIGLAASLSDDDTRRSLLGISDYFQRQAELASEEGFKLPDV